MQPPLLPPMGNDPAGPSGAGPSDGMEVGPPPATHAPKRAIELTKKPKRAPPAGVPASAGGADEMGDGRAEVERARVHAHAWCSKCTGLIRLSIKIGCVSTAARLLSLTCQAFLCDRETPLPARYGHRRRRESPCSGLAA